jgi:hypothetical protein
MTRRQALACAAACIGGFVPGCRGLTRRRTGTTTATPRTTTATPKTTTATPVTIPGTLDQEYLKKVDWLSTLDPYPMLLERVLLEPYPSRVCEMLAIPSFDLEHAVFLTCTVDGWAVVSRTVKEQIWSALAHVRTGAAQGPGNEELYARFGPTVRTRTRRIPTEMAQRLADVWSEMLARTVPGRLAPEIDGDLYRFKHGELVGSTSRGRLVALGEALVVLSAQSDDDPEISRRVDSIIADQARALVKGLGGGRHVTGELTCR